MDDKRLPIDYLYRARSDLQTILQREPKAPDIVYDACEAALAHVCIAISHLDSTVPKQPDRNGETVLKNLEERFELSRRQPSDLGREIAEWLASHNESESASHRVLKWIQEDLEKAKAIDAASVQSEIAEAIPHIERAIERLKPPSP